ncbi:MAG: thermonuclease family protein [Gemmatimonadota bacterium]|nr:thermonuclease family protein [Gemmatimonadota bacterium]
MPQGRWVIVALAASLVGCGEAAQQGDAAAQATTTQASVALGAAELGTAALGAGAQRPSRNARSDEPCVIKKLADGDSFTCADGRKVRLLLIDTPETAQKPWGLMAKRQLETLAGPGTTVRLELDRTATDRYGRTLAYVWVDSVMVNEWMVARGWAVVLAYENVRYLDRLQRAERAAQAGKKGFWQAWAFRCRPVDFRAHRCGNTPTPEKRKSRRS